MIIKSLFLTYWRRRKAKTTNTGHAPRNVAPRKGEGGLPEESVVNVTQITTVDKSDFGKKIGSLSPARTDHIIEGIRLLLTPGEF